MKRISAFAPPRSTQPRLIEAAQHGDAAAIDHLVRRYDPLVQRVVWRVKPPRGCEREDLAQEARIGLIAAIRAWQPERGPFPAFADRCVTNQTLLAVEAAARKKHQILSRAVSLDREDVPYSYDEGTHEWLRLDLLDKPTAEDPDGDPESRLLAREQFCCLVRALPTLTASERLAVAGMVSGESYQRLARARGCTPKAASQAAYRARRKLAAELARAE